MYHHFQLVFVVVNRTQHSMCNQFHQILSISQDLHFSGNISGDLYLGGYIEQLVEKEIKKLEGKNGNNMSRVQG